MTDWNRYLDSVCQEPEYTQWEQVFTPLDVQGPSSRTQFDLMVQAFRDHKKSERKKGSPPAGESEKYTALEGLRKFAGVHVLLRGRPGSGKSTILHKLLIEEANKARNNPEARIPVFVALRRYETSVINLVRDSLQRHGVRLAIQKIEALLNQGRLFLLCDGVNELPKEDFRRGLESFRLRYGTATPMVFSTRHLGLGSDLGILKKLEILPLNPKQIDAFVQAYIGDRRAASRMLKSLRNGKRDLARTPLLLWLLCSVFKARAKIPGGLGQVFRGFTNIYAQELKRDAPVSAESRRWWPKLLAKLAYHMMGTGKQPTDMALLVPRDDAENVLWSYLVEQGVDKSRARASQFLNDLIDHHLLREDPQGGIEFLHQLIQEYYVAEYLLSFLPILGTAKPNRLKRLYLNYLKWTEPVAMMMEFLDKKNQAIEFVRMALDIDPMLGARLAGCVKREFQEESVDLVLSLYEPLGLKIKLLSNTGSEAAVPFLASCLNDKSYSVSQQAAKGLANIGSVEAIQHLIKALRDKNSYLRSAAAQALGNIRGDEVTKHLIMALQDKESRVRGEAASALGNIGGVDSIKYLIKTLEDKESNVQVCARIALKNIDGDETVRYLIKALEDKKPRLRSSAAWVLGIFEGNEGIKHLINALEDKESRVRGAAAQALGDRNTKKAVKPLIKALKDTEPNVRVLAAEALGRIRSKEAVRPLITLMKEKDPEVRVTVAAALGDIGGDKALKPLIEALSDSDPDVRSCAAFSVGLIGGDVAAKHLRTALEDSNQDVRMGAVRGLGFIGGVEATKYLIEALSDKDRDVRSATAEALADIGSEDAIEHLMKVLQGDKDGEVRGTAAWVLGQIGACRATKHLIKAVEDDPDVCTDALGALGHIGTEEAREFLIKTIKKVDFAPYQYMYLHLPLDPKALPHLRGLAEQKNADFLEIIAAIQQRYRFYNPAMLSIDRKFCIVHLSDLHFGGLDRAADLYLGLLLDLRKELNLPGFEALVISGDLVNQCRKDGYDHAKNFLSRLAKKFNMTAEKVLVVPGNHDVDWDVSEAAYTPKRRKELAGSLNEHLHIDKGEFVEVKDESKYPKRFTNFHDFCEKAALGDYPLEYSDQIAWREYPDQKILLVGLNSSWELDHHYAWRSGLHPDALNQAIEKVAEERYNDWLKIAAWHHPIKSGEVEATESNKSWIRDDGFMERLAVAGFSMILHGHAHSSGTWKFRTDTGNKTYEMHVIGAGTLDAYEDQLIPGSFWQYNIIKIIGTKVSIECRRRINPRGISRPDKTWLKSASNKSSYDFEIANESVT